MPGAWALVLCWITVVLGLSAWRGWGARRCALRGHCWRETFFGHRCTRCGLRVERVPLTQIRFLKDEHEPVYQHAEIIPHVGETVEIPGWPPGQAQQTYRVKAVHHLLGKTAHVAQVIDIELEDLARPRGALGQSST